MHDSAKLVVRAVGLVAMSDPGKRSNSRGAVLAPILLTLLLALVPLRVGGASTQQMTALGQQLLAGASLVAAVRVAASATR